MSMGTAPSHTRIVKQLIEKEVDVNTPNESRYSRTYAITFAAKVGNVETVKLLIANGCDVNIRDFHVKTALTYAVEGGHDVVVDNLLDAGAMVGRHALNAAQNDEMHKKLKMHSNILKDE